MTPAKQYCRATAMSLVEDMKPISQPPLEWNLSGYCSCGGSLAPLPQPR